MTTWTEEAKTGVSTVGQFLEINTSGDVLLINTAADKLEKDTSTTLTGQTTWANESKS